VPERLRGEGVLRARKVEGMGSSVPEKLRGEGVLRARKVERRGGPLYQKTLVYITKR
jgi:hypothetical protein